MQLKLKDPACRRRHSAAKSINQLIKSKVKVQFMVICFCSSIALSKTQIIWSSDLPSTILYPKVGFYDSKMAATTI